MAKRLADTNKYNKPFYRGLPGAYKLLWDYLYLSCDHAGIWIVDFDIVQILLGTDMQVNKADALKYFNSDEVRIIEVSNGRKWFLPSFIPFQYKSNEMNPENKVHESIISILCKHNLIDHVKVLASPFRGAKDKEKDKVKEKDQRKGGAGGKENPAAAANGVPYHQKAELSPAIDSDEQLAEYQQWTDMILAGQDQHFEALLMKNKLELVGEAANDHLETLSRYPKMRPASQQSFRLSLIKHLREWAGKKKESSPFAAKPQDKFYTPPPKVTEPSYDIAQTISAAPDETWTSSISRDAEKLAANPNFKPILGIKKLEYLLKKKLVEYTAEQKASYREEAKVERMNELEADKIDSHSRRLLKEYQENNIRPEELKLLVLKSQEIAYTDYLFGEVEKLKAATA